MSYPAFHTPADGEERGLGIAVILGAALVVVGLGLIVYSVGLQDSAPLFLLGGLTIGGGVFRMTTALSRETRRRREMAESDDPRWHGGAGIVQLAGRTCIECGKKIVVGADGVCCDPCDATLHLDCEMRHHSTVHEAAESRRALRRSN